MTEFSRKLLFRSNLMGFSRCVYYNAIVWQNLNPHQLSPWLPGLHAACVIPLARHPAASQGKTRCQNSFHQVSYPSSSSFFPFCSLSQNLTCINSWKSSSSRVGSVSFHWQFNLLCWQAESTCSQGPRKNRHILSQSATNKFIEQYTKQCSMKSHQPTCWNP